MDTRPTTPPIREAARIRGKPVDDLLRLFLKTSGSYQRTPDLAKRAFDQWDKSWYNEPCRIPPGFDDYCSNIVFEDAAAQAKRLEQALKISENQPAPLETAA